MLLELLATFCASLFAGAAVYINFVEHPARMEVGTAAAVLAWRPSYRRATVMQASLAVVGSLSAIGAWLTGQGVVVLIAGLALGSVVPFTLLVIAPTNKALGDPALDVTGPRAAELMGNWNRLHAVRSAAAVIALALLLLDLGATL